MKTINFLKFRINWSFNFYRVKIVTVPIPIKADDTHYNDDGKCIVYWLGCEKHTIDLPPHKIGKKIHLTPMYNKKKFDENGWKRNTKRVIKVELLN
jgi:hypothetical protein